MFSEVGLIIDFATSRQFWRGCSRCVRQADFATCRCGLLFRALLLTYEHRILSTVGTDLTVPRKIRVALKNRIVCRFFSGGVPGWIKRWL